jgi:cell division protein FtsW
MKSLAPPDRLMVGSILLLACLSIIMVASASMGVAEARYGDAYRIIHRWFIYLPAGLLVMWWLSSTDISWWRVSIIPLLSFSLLLLVLIPPLGVEMNGARRWFSIFGLTLQPVELVKPVLIIYMAYYLASFPERLKQFSTGLAPMLVVLGTAVLLLLVQPDFGNAALIVGVSACMWFVGGIPIHHLLILLSTVLPIGLVIILAEPYRVERMLSFIDPWSDPLGSGYQLVQSMLAFGSGGLQGAGLGQGVQKLFYLPEPFTDFIVAVLAEEMGLLGTLGLILLFALILWRGMRLCFQAQDEFARLLSLGCVLLIASSFFINMGAAMGVMPTKGMPMPMLSYGGSALIGTCILFGLLLSVQRHVPENSRREQIR